MHIKFFTLSKKSGLLFLLAALGCTSSQPGSTIGSTPEVTVKPLEKQQEQNILLAEWTGPFGGVPAFDKMNLPDIKPAMEKV